MDRLTDIPLLEGWIPIRLYWQDQEPIVDWCYLGSDSLTEPFFSQTVELCIRRPFNLLFRHQTPIEILRRLHQIRPGLEPSGLIFHLSRCGSTLVSQTLASLSRNIVISEAGVIDSILRAHFRNPGVTDDQRIAWLRWMVSALGQTRNKAETDLFIKFDAWNILDLPLIRKAFPDVPWIFLYRDPVEVLVSQFGQRGAHMIPGVINPGLFGLEAGTATTMLPEEYCARVLASVCHAALRYCPDGGRLINYTQLPEAVWTFIPDVFGVRLGDNDIETMRASAKLDAKNPAMTFADDTVRKKQKATSRIHEAATQWLYPVYEELEAARLAGR